ncbi:MAG TPA: hypothetical protein VGK67_14030 [Myxococcales bacterium]|jgi:hypothetical protein
MTDKTTPTPASRAIVRDDRGRIVPGVSLNPGGRPGGVRALVTELTGEGCREVFERLATIARGEPVTASKDRWGDAREVRFGAREIVEANRILLEYGVGRPTQRVDLAAAVAIGPMPASALDPDSLRSMTDSELAVVEHLLALAVEGAVPAFSVADRREYEEHMRQLAALTMRAELRQPSRRPARSQGAVVDAEIIPNG